MNETRRALRALQYFRSLLNSHRAAVRIIAAPCIAAAIGGICTFEVLPHSVASGGLLPPIAAINQLNNNDSLYRVVIIAQRADCSSNLNHLAFLNRAAIANHIVDRLILLAGPARDTIGLRWILPHGLEKSRIALLHSEQQKLLEQLGHNETPTLALYDSRNRLLVLSATPSDAFQRTVFVRAVTRILTGNPAP
jgi:hypothetical protein